MLHVAAIVMVCLALGCIGLIVSLVLMRLGFDRVTRRREAHASRLRQDFFALVMGEPADQTAAAHRLHRLEGRDWEFASKQAFALLPKLRGESREELSDLLRSRGSIERALRLVRSGSSVRRCRGAFAIGALRDREHADVLIALLDDPAFLVRRVAVRALGSLAAPEAVGALLDLGREEPRMSRDIISALRRIGPEGLDEMRSRLRAAIDGAEPDRSAELVASVLGALGDYPSRSLLTAGLASTHIALAVACADALGAVSAPDTEPALVQALSHPSPRVRAGAAQALGSMGSALAVEPLALVVEAADQIGSREAAAALMNLGEAGRGRLERCVSPYAAEALAIANLGRRS